MKKYLVTVQPGGWVFGAAADASLLASAEAAGVVLPSSCRNGTCRSCICRLDSGAVSYLVAWPGLSSDEKRDGWILPCVALPTSDLSLTSPMARRVPA
jgi:ferredoxin